MLSHCKKVITINRLTLNQICAYNDQLDLCLESNLTVDGCEYEK